MRQPNRIWRPMLWNIVGHIQLWKQWKPRAKMDEGRVGEKEGENVRKEGAVGALTMTKKGPGQGWGVVGAWEGLHLHCILPRTSPDVEEFYGSTQLYCTSLQLFIALALFIHKRHIWKRGSSTHSDSLHDWCRSPRPTPHKSMGSDLQRPFLTPNASSTSHCDAWNPQRAFLWVRRGFLKLQPFDYVGHCFCQVCIPPVLLLI